MLVYLNESPVRIRQYPDSEFGRAVEQLKALKNFVGEFCRDPETGEAKGAYTTYEDLGRFEELLERHLAKLIERKFPAKSINVAAEVNPVLGWAKPIPWPRTIRLGAFADLLRAHRATGEVLALLKNGWRMSKIITLPRIVRVREGEAFVLISAMSGVGKSSLVRAGVLPLLLDQGFGLAVGAVRRCGRAKHRVISFTGWRERLPEPKPFRTWYLAS